MKHRILIALGIILGIGVVACQEEDDPVVLILADFTSEFSEPDSLGKVDITFTNNSENATSYLWDFGDGTNSTETDPVHQYEKGGIYTIRLTAFGEDGNNQISRTLEVNPEPIADFDLQACDSLSFAPCPVRFFNQSQNATLYWWDFGDGTTSTESDPIHHYQEGGTFTVRLTAKNQWGEDQTIKTTYVAVPPPVPFADFEYQGGNCTAPCDVIFSNISKDADEYLWDFGDGATSDKENPTYNYSKGGTYTVRLTTTNARGKHTISRSVLVKSSPVANFEMENNGCVAHCEVRFTNTSENAVLYLWDFGDGEKSDLENPRHTFTTVGNFTVKLKAINEDGKTSEKTQEVVIR